MQDLVELFLDSNATLEWEKRGLRSRRDLQVCAAALLLLAAHSDGQLVAQEVTTTVKRIAEHFAEPPGAAAAIVEVADVFQRSGRPLSDLIAAINNRFEHAQKITIVGMIWSVILADGIVRDPEAQFASTLATGLHLTPDDVRKAHEYV